MVYSTNRDFQQHLRALIADDLNAEAENHRSSRAIIRAVNMMLVEKRRAHQQITDDNAERYLRNFANGQSWGDEKTKALISEMYEFENALIVVRKGDPDPGVATRIFENYFQRGNGAFVRLEGLVGKFFIYKRAIKDPKELVVRGYIEFTMAESGVLKVAETHINRSHIDRAKSQVKAKDREPAREDWTGMVLPRERCYCMITAELSKGTPKFAALQPIDSGPGKIKTLRGESLECVEGWGVPNLLPSPVYLERVNDEFSLGTDMRQIDLVSVAKLRKSHPYIVAYLGL